MSMPLNFEKQKHLQAGIGVTHPEFPFPGTLFLEKHGSVERSFLQPPLSSSLPATIPNIRGNRSTCGFGLNTEAAPNEALGSSRKRLLIFDQSGSQTRLIRCCSASLSSPLIDLAKPTIAPDACDKLKLLRVDQFALKSPILLGELDGDQVDGNESEMHEDTEEINALLYSDEDYDSNDDSDDDVMSTGHSPFPDKKIQEVEGLWDGKATVAAVNHSTKRQKLLEDGCNKPSFLDTASSINLEGSSSGGNVAESAGEQTDIEETGLSSSDDRSRRVKIHTALRILESIVPGSEDKDSMMVLDEAIDYLKLLKENVKALGVSNF